MRARLMTLLAGLLVAAALVPAFMASLEAQGSAPAGSYVVPRTAWGHPDFQGNWNVATLTPMERPEKAANNNTLTKEQAAGIEREERERVEQRARPSDPNRPAPVVGGNVGGYNNFWIDRGSTTFLINGQYRTSVIIDPPDGRIPPQTPDARRRNAAARGTVVRPTSDAPESAQPEGVGAFDDVELRPLGERCILGFGSTSGPPTLPNYFYNNYKQIVQTKDHVMILVEMVHDVRIIRLNGAHPPSHIRNWMGDSIGHWEGDTLVVETTNFTNKTRFRGSSENMKVIERIRRIDADTLLYQFTIDDPATWTRTWTGEYPWEATTEQIYEYACHEGNYALGDIMRGERLLDKERAAKQSR